MPFTPVFAPRGNTLKTCNPDQADATFDIVAFTGTVLGDKSKERLALLFWARVNGTRGEIGSSVSEFCREMDWSRSRFEKTRRRACERVVAAKNTIDCRYVAAA
ncbi:hypothetical protein [Methylobacterium haplocladii]|nr:hypothetical protein [Methylobacterium haplocladii]GJD85461.1 hypothetical protein HPGCJGGD_3350 [Methylobacterium haplocladii]